jgi:hypothetical protein
LGNAPVLAPQERLYRQLLAGDTSDAVRDLDYGLGDNGFAQYLDEIAIPSLRIASQDRQRGVLAADQLAKLKRTLDDYVSHVRELLDFRREQRHVQACADASVPPRPSETASALVIAGRGILDQAAAELVADAIRFRLGIPVQCPSLGGLTGIGAVADVIHRHPDFVVLISVGEITPTQLDLLLSRIGRVFTASTIVLANWGGWHMSASLRDFDGIVRAETAASLVDTLGRLAAERAANPRSRLEAV